MTITERREYTKEFLMQAINAGIQIANKSVDPLDDRLKKKDIKKWSKLIGLKDGVVEALAAKGAIREYRNGIGSNAARFYSKAEIHTAILLENIQTGFSGKFQEMALI